MKPKYVKLISAFLCVAVTFCAVFFTRTVIHGSESKPQIYLYYNDRAWTRANHPVHVNEKGAYYAPLTFFIQLSDVSARVNETLQTFVIARGDRYLSFDIATDYAANEDKIRIPLRTYEYDGERYVPMDAVCYYLDLDFEVITSIYTGDVAIRVANGQEQYTFSSLLRRRHPDFFEDTQTADTDTETSLKEETTQKPPKVTEPPSTKETTSSDTTRAPYVSDTTADPREALDLVIYISVKGMPGEHTDEILELLDRYGYKATFFIEKDLIYGNVSELMRIITGGHTVGIYVPEADGYDEIIAEIEACNALLARLTKYKSGLWLPSDETAFSEEDAAALNAKGYTRWSDNLAAESGSGNSTKALIAAVRENEISSVEFTGGDNAVKIMEQLFIFTEEYEGVCEVRTADRPKLP